MGDNDIGRKRPSPGVHIYSGEPTIVFMTVCAHERKPWIANSIVHEQLRESWQTAEAWVVGYYLLMPDHIHLFCSPRDLNFTIEQWVTFWTRQFRRIHKDANCHWQSHPFHHRLRREESYRDKWNYVRENPLRKGLVKNPDDWPSCGMMNVLRW